MKKTRAPRALLQYDRRRFLRDLSAAGLVLQGSMLGLSCKGRKDTGDSGQDDIFYFAVISDLHLQDDPEHLNNQVLEQTIDILNGFEVPLDFVLMAGDIVDELPSDDPGWYEDHDDTPLHRLQQQLQRLDMPAHMVLGNHDYYTNGEDVDSHMVEDKAAREALFLDYAGMPSAWYRFEHQGVSFLGLSSMQDDARVGWTPNRCGSFGEEQLAWLEEQLADGGPFFLFFHHPLALDNVVAAGLASFFPFEVPRAEGQYEKYEGTEYEGWTDPIYALLQEHAAQVLAIFVGHGHWFVQDEYEGTAVLMGDSVGNSVQATSVWQGGEEQPMRYHIVACNLTKGTFEVYNQGWFEYSY